MAEDNFEAVMDNVFLFEGGYVDHPRDPGGATNMGITIGTLRAHRGRPVSKQDVRELTKAEAREIYRKRYWQPVWGGKLPYGLDYVAMDGGVNSGPRRGIQWLQRGIGAKADGKMGPNTLDKANTADMGAIERACDARMGFLRGLRTWDVFGRGWGRRVAHVEAHATRMWLSVYKPAGVETKTVLGMKAAQATKNAAKAKQAGVAQSTAAGAGGAATSTQPDLLPVDPWIIGVLVVGLMVVLGFRAWKNADRQQARSRAFTLLEQMEDLK